MRPQWAWFRKLWLVMNVLGVAGCALMTTSVDKMAAPVTERAQAPPAAQSDRADSSELNDPAAEWAQAQRDIAALSPPVTGNPFAVSMDQFVIETEEEPFICGETGIHAFLLVYGCFRAEPQGSRLGVIRHVLDPGVLRHEARHAILFALGDPRWPEVGH